MNYQLLVDRIRELQQRTDHVFIYGFGGYGRNLYYILQQHDVSVDGFVVTEPSEMDLSASLSCKKAKDTFDGNNGYIIAVNENYMPEIHDYLLTAGVQKENIISDTVQYIQGSGNRKRSNGFYEVTTMMGCSVNCRYCPQSALLAAYYKDNTSRKSCMDIATFRRSLEFFPEWYDITFAGMSEPFLNENTMDMLKMACETKRKIYLYTTLVGLRKEQVDDLVQLPLEYVVLHVADKKGYSNIPHTEDYFELLERIVNERRGTGGNFVNSCNAQGEPLDRVRDICQGKQEILTQMTDRAGNLEDAGLIRNQFPVGSIGCWNVSEDHVNCILLPDGTILLCCMDYGMKHVLGNIFQQTFDEIISGDEMKKIHQGMSGDTSIDILCRACSYARKI